MRHVLYMCAIRWVNGQDERLKCLWTCYDSRCQAHWFECVKNCNAAGVFMFNSFPCASRMVHHLKDIQPTWHNCALESKRNSIPVERFQHLVESMPRWIEAVLRTKGEATQYKEGVPNVLCTQCLQKVFTPLHFSHIFICYILNLKWIKYRFYVTVQYTIPHNVKVELC